MACQMKFPISGPGPTLSLTPRSGRIKATAEVEGVVEARRWLRALGFRHRDARSAASVELSSSVESSMDEKELIAAFARTLHWGYVKDTTGSPGRWDDLDTDGRKI